MNKKILPFVIIIGFIFAITRGWAIFAAFPFWVIATIALIYGTIGFAKLPSTKINAFDSSLQYAWFFAYIATLLCTVSGGDTSTVWAFGFFPPDGSSQVAQISSLLSMVFGIVFTALTLTVIFELHRIRQRIKPQSPTRHRVFLIAIGIVAIVFIYFVGAIIYSSTQPEIRYCNGKALATGQACND